MTSLVLLFRGLGMFFPQYFYFRALQCGSTAISILSLGIVFLGQIPSALAQETDAMTLRVQAEMKEILKSPGLEDSLMGVFIQRLSDGKTLFAHNEDKLLNPASNMKLVTSAAALKYLGPHYRFRTTVHRDQGFSGGVVKGNLYVKGHGDPSLTTETLFGLVNNVAMAGVTRVTGDLVVDESFFDKETEGPGWEQEEEDHAYNAPIGALSVNFNTFEARVVPGPKVGAPAKLLLWPDVPSLNGDLSVRTRGSRTRTRVWFGTTRLPDDRVRITARGSIAIDNTRGRSLRKRIHDPGRFAGEMLKKMLGMRGITVQGKVRRGIVPQNSAVRIAVHLSKPLSEVVSLLNKWSNNFIAEMCLKTMSAEVKNAPGSWKKGAEVLSEYLQSIGVKADGYILGNGSGLNDVNRLTARQITRVLASMYSRFDLAPEYIASLAVAGLSGTIQGRFDNSAASSKLRAKTGTLIGVSALSGYVSTQDDDIIAFSVMMNDYNGRARTMWRIQDKIGVALARLSVSKEVGLN